MLVVDLNADLGEGAGHDTELLPLITSANVCCGFHAGGLEEASRTIAAACQHGVAIGAHPGFADREHFGRRELPLQPDDVRTLTAYQLGALIALADTLDARILYVKPHGALYHQLARDRRLAHAFVLAVQRWNLPVVGWPGSHLEAACLGRLPFIREGFADRRYRPDGTLVPRHEPDALLEDPHEAAEQAERLVREQGIQTLCVHGDTPKAVTLVQNLREFLLTRGCILRPFVGCTPSIQ